MGVRYGHSAEIGSRRVMEDRTVAVSDMFRADAPPSLRSRSAGFFPVSAGLPLQPFPNAASVARAGDGSDRKRSLSASVAEGGKDKGGGDGGDGGSHGRSLSEPAATEKLRLASAAGAAVAGGAPAPAGAADGGGGGGGGDGAAGRSRSAKAAAEEGAAPKEGGGTSELATVTESSIETSFSASTSTNGSGGGGGEVGSAAYESEEDGGAGSAKTLVSRSAAVNEDVSIETRVECEKGTRQGAVRGVERGTMDEQQRPPLSAAFFGVYDGHDGDVVAEALQKSLHKLIAKQVCRRGRRVGGYVCTAAAFVYWERGGRAVIAVFMRQLFGDLRGAKSPAVHQQDASVLQRKRQPNPFSYPLRAAPLLSGPPYSTFPKPKRSASGIAFRRPSSAVATKWTPRVSRLKSGPWGVNVNVNANTNPTRTWTRRLCRH